MGKNHSIQYANFGSLKLLFTYYHEKKEGIPEELLQSDNTHEDVTEDKPKRTTPHNGSIMVTIRTREGLCIQKKGLDYQGLKTLVEKLEGLC